MRTMSWGRRQREEEGAVQCPRPESAAGIVFGVESLDSYDEWCNSRASAVQSKVSTGVRLQLQAHGPGLLLGLQDYWVRTGQLPVGTYFRGPAIAARGVQL